MYQSLCTYTREALHVSFDHIWVRTLQLANHVKALVELREHISHGTGELGMLGSLLELYTAARKCDLAVSM